MAMQRDVVTVERFYTEHSSSLGLNLIAGAEGLKRIIREPTVNRPGLALAGFKHYFAGKRVQVMGNAECHYLKELTPKQRTDRYHDLFQHKIPCVVFCRNFEPDREFLKCAEEKDIPVFSSPQITMRFINLATLALELMFAPKGSEMGSMVDILGVGVIIKGESGIGKSESVLALIEHVFTSLTFADSFFVMTDNVGGIYYSADGITWNGRAEAPQQFTAAAFGNGAWLAVGGDSILRATAQFTAKSAANLQLVQSTANTWNLVVTGSPGEKWQIQSAASCVSAQWSNTQLVEIPVTGKVTLPMPAANASLFFRAVVTQP